MENQEALDQILAKLKELDERMEKIENYLERQKGFIGGILFIGTCIAGIIPLIKDWWK